MKKKKECKECFLNPVKNKYACVDCLREKRNLYYRQKYAAEFKAEPHEYKKKNKKRIDYRLKIAKDIRSKSGLKKSLSRTFGAHPETKYRPFETPRFGSAN